MKNTKKLVSVLLVAMLLITTVVASSASASAAGTLTSYYKTNPNNQVGTQKTISIDGDLSDWNSSMLIAQGTANDDPRVYRENSMHELPVDLYALYGAYDDNNLYLMWEMTNVGDAPCPTPPPPPSWREPCRPGGEGRDRRHPLGFRSHLRPQLQQNHLHQHQSTERSLRLRRRLHRSERRGNL